MTEQKMNKGKRNSALKRLLIAALNISIFQYSIFNFLSCDNFSCPLNNTVESIYGFYAADRDEAGELITGRSVSLGDTLTVRAIDIDSVLANKLVNVSNMQLPVSYYNEADALELLFTDKQARQGRDTVWVTKRNQPHWDDPSCAVHVWHTITDVQFTHNLIDTLVISNPEVNYDGLENIQIYFRTSQDSNEDDEEATDE